MGLLTWLHRYDSGKLSADEAQRGPEIDPEEDLFEGLSLGQAIQAHVAWKKRLKAIVQEGRQDSVEIAEVAPDDLCDLGRWLHGAARKRFSHLPQYARLRKLHADFHLAAGQVLLLSRNGRRDDAEKLLRGPFSTLSDQVQFELVRLYAASRDS
jgi:hypothetical protein